MKLILICLFLATSAIVQANTKLFFQNQIKNNKQVLTKEDRVSFLKAFLKSKKIKVSISDLILDEESESLLAIHYTYKQILNGLDIENSSITISVDKKSNQILKVYNTITKTSTSFFKSKSSLPLMNKEQAIELAWNSLNSDGELLSTPESNLYFSKKKSLVLIYKIVLSTSSPFGHWLVEINARTGEVLSIKDQALSRKSHEQSVQKRLEDKRVSISYGMALSKFRKQLTKKKTKSNTIVNLADGEAKLFDPNPVTTLERSDLQDNSHHGEFDGAYFFDTLKNLTVKNGVYHLAGPRIILDDFESPEIKPSTTTDGKWHHERKNIKFNDAMTYYHLDKSISYLESLGFDGDKKIFKKAMKVDANGVNGADNSHYIPSARRLAFGHGCVDDNEDTDVILHELGHAINHHINKRWSGGDTKAMGEGFGDYWAASYSTSRKGGMEFKPNWVFKWDGHNKCWGGRKLNATSIRYNHNHHYGAHNSVRGGISDELWSTPIFQTFLELRKRGVDRSDLDKIIIESQFGLGYGLKMRDLAKVIVKTAKALFPTEDYAAVYTKHFKKQKILE